MFPEGYCQVNSKAIMTEGLVDLPDTGGSLNDQSNGRIVRDGGISAARRRGHGDGVGAGGSAGIGDSVLTPTPSPTAPDRTAQYGRSEQN